MNNKSKKFIKEVLRYSVAGLSAFVCDTLIKVLFYSWILPLNMGEFTIFGFTNEIRVIIATVAGFSVGLIVNYVISIFYVFTSEKQKQMGRGVKAFIIYFLVSIVGLLINVGVTQLGCNLLDIQRNPAIFGLISCVAAAVALIWNYFGRKVLVYKGE